MIRCGRRPSRACPGWWAVAKTGETQMSQVGRIRAPLTGRCGPVSASTAVCTTTAAPVPCRRPSGGRRPRHPPACCALRHRAPRPCDRVRRAARLERLKRPGGHVGRLIRLAGVALVQAGQIVGDPPIETRGLLGDLRRPMIRLGLAAARNFEPSSATRRALNGPDLGRTAQRRGRLRQSSLRCRGESRRSS